MIQQDQLSPCSSSQEPPIDLIRSLLQQNPHVSHHTHEQHFLQIREQMLHNRIDLGKDQARLFGLSLLDNQDQNCLFPQKLELDPPEEELLLTGTVPSCTTASPLPTLKRESKIDRSAYLEESRAVKIARYREKKQRRIWDRKIFYDCRKKVADNRQRINGRFVKKSPELPGKEVSSTQKTSATIHDLDPLPDLQLQDVKLYGFSP